MGIVGYDFPVYFLYRFASFSSVLVINQSSHCPVWVRMESNELINDSFFKEVMFYICFWFWFESSGSTAVKLWFIFSTQKRESYLMFVVSGACLLCRNLGKPSVWSTGEARCTKLVLLFRIDGGYSGACYIYSQTKMAHHVSCSPNSLY